MHEVHGYEGKHDGIDPTHDVAHKTTLGCLPPCPRNELSDISVEDEGHYDKSPPALYPEQEEKVQGQYYAKLYPLLGSGFLNSIHILQQITQIYRIIIFLSF